MTRNGLPVRGAPDHVRPFRGHPAPARTRLEGDDFPQPTLAGADTTHMKTFSIVPTVVLVLALGLAGCGSTPGSNPCPGPSNAGGSQAASPSSLPTALVGHWVGQMEPETDSEVTFSKDGTCVVTQKLWTEDKADPDGKTFSWRVAGSDAAPDPAAPWLLQVKSADLSYVPSYEIVSIDADTFTVYEKVEGNDIYMIMKRQN